MNVEDLQRELEEAKRVLEIASKNLTAAKRSYDEALRAFLLGRREQIHSFQIKFPGRFPEERKP
jgi:hypothetical protein